MFTCPRGITNKLPGSVKAAALASALTLSALLTAVALRSSDHHWLAWISFLPLFAVVRSLGPTNRAATVRERFSPPRPDRFLTGAARMRLFIRPLRENGAPAALAGGFWGGCLYLFCSAGPARTIEPSAWLLALLILIPAVYVGLAARPARCGTGKRAGLLTVSSAINLLTLALGWTLIEAVLHIHHPTTGREGLLIGAPGEGVQLHWLARLLGYVCTAFVVACVNASLVGILSGARLRFPHQTCFVVLPKSRACPSSQSTLCFQLLALLQVYPRGPPLFPLADAC